MGSELDIRVVDPDELLALEVLAGCRRPSPTSATPSGSRDWAIATIAGL